MNKTQAPLQLLAGGYIGTFNVTSGSGGSRLLRRNIPRVCGIGARWAIAVNAATFLNDLWARSLPWREIVGNAQIYRQQLQIIQRRREAAEKLSVGLPGPRGVRPARGAFLGTQR